MQHIKSLFVISIFFIGISSCRQEKVSSKEYVLYDQLIASMAASNKVSSIRRRSSTVTTECAVPAKIKASSNYWAGIARGAIDCDFTTAWNSGGGNAAWYDIIFEPGRVFSGLHITSAALPAETQRYTVTATRPDNSTIVLNDDFTIGDLSNTTSGGISEKDFDFGQGFVEYKSVRIAVNGSTNSWKAIMEVELIVPNKSVIVDAGRVDEALSIQ